VCDGSAYYTDGGVRDATPLGEAIRAGATEVDVVLVEAVGLPRWTKKDRVLAIGPRALGIMASEIVETDIKIALLYNELAAAGRTGKRAVKIRVLRPKSNLLDDPLDFDTAKARANIERGYEDAKSFFAE
jgi:predicted patatin/cPLA2 family phospholipase